MMRNILAALVLSMTLMACGSNEAATTAQTTAAAPKVVDGAKVYKSYCVTCHGLYGDMGASGAANLQESQLSEAERITVITKGRNTMASFENLLKPEEIKAVAAYTMNIGQ